MFVIRPIILDATMSVSADMIKQMESASYAPLEPTSRAWIYACRQCGMLLITIERSNERYSAFGLPELKKAVR